MLLEVVLLLPIFGPSVNSFPCAPTPVADLKEVSSKALETAVSTVTSYKAGVKAVVEESVSQCVAQLEQQESLSGQARQTLLHMLVKHSSTQVKTASLLGNVSLHALIIQRHEIIFVSFPCMYIDMR